MKKIESTEYVDDGDDIKWITYLYLSATLICCMHPAYYLVCVYVYFELVSHTN